MQGLSKRIFFWILVIFFFITTPVIIIYTLGYRFNPQRGIFVYTGSISIKSNPLDVQVFIDGEQKNKSLNRLNNSYNIGGLKPGEHLIEVKSPGFSSWAKKITVSSGTSTEFWNVMLLRDSYGSTSYPTDGIDKFFFDPGKKLIAYTLNNNGEFLVNILDVSGNKSENVFSSKDYSFTDDKKENIEWSPQSKKIMIPVMKGGEKNYFLVDVETKESTNLKDVTNSENITRARWDRNNKDFIYYMSGGNLYYFNTQNPEEKKIIAKDIASYDLSSSYVYYFQLPSGTIYRLSSDGSGDPEQITTSAPDKMNDPDYQITVYDQDRIALLNKSGDLYIQNTGGNADYFRNLASVITEIQFSDDGKKMLYWSDSEICVYYTRDWEVQPWRSENDQKEIIRFSKMIGNVQWSKDYEHVIFNVGNKLKITEIDNRSQNNTGDILSLTSENSKIVSDPGDSKIYFTGIDNEINQLFSINFPEKTGILGF